MARRLGWLLRLWRQGSPRFPLRGLVLFNDGCNGGAMVQPWARATVEEKWLRGYYTGPYIELRVLAQAEQRTESVLQPNRRFFKSSLQI
jgi:hypothetical protein